MKLCVFVQVFPIDNTAQVLYTKYRQGDGRQAGEAKEERMMDAKATIKKMLKERYAAGDVEAMLIFKGYDVGTHRYGWHYRFFGRSNAIFCGKSLRDAKEFLTNEE